jgi:hypothetical protein
VPSTASPLEHAIASIASSSTPLDRFALDLDCFTRSTPPPSAPEHAVDLDRFTDAQTVHFTDAPDYTLHSTPSFPSPQVIHEELVN